MSSLKRILLVMRHFTRCELVKHLILPEIVGTGAYLDYSFIDKAHQVPGQEDKGVMLFSNTGNITSGDLYDVGFTTLDLKDMRRKLDELGKKSVEVRLVADLLTEIFF